MPGLRESSIGSPLVALVVRGCGVQAEHWQWFTNDLLRAVGMAPPSDQVELSQRVPPRPLCGINPSRWNQFRYTIGGHPYHPLLPMNLGMMKGTEQATIFITGITEIPAPVRVGQGRGTGRWTGPFPLAALPNRTCDFHRIRLSTSQGRAGRAGVDQGVGIFEPRYRNRWIVIVVGWKRDIPLYSGHHRR